MNVLITGGLGFIGSHTVLQLLSLNHEVVILDNLSNSSLETKRTIEVLSGKENLKFYNFEIQDEQSIKTIFSENKIDFVIHLAGLKSVSESIHNSLKYYDTNISGSLNLIKIMLEFDVKNIIFSSSATVYNKNQSLPWVEESNISFPDNPYGISKLLIERMLLDASREINDFRVGVLRYFNPIGAHKSGLIGDQFNSESSNLVPNILRVIQGKQKTLNIYGNDYETPDGTGIRDYIHVMDLAEGHLKTMKYLQNKDPQFLVLNLGTGEGTSVLELIRTYEKINQVKISFSFADRRKGDLPITIADNSLMKSLLKWSPKLGLEEMCKDGYQWALRNMS